MEDLKEQIKHSPDLPGVYLYRDETGKILYVGKALSLRRRLSNYVAALPGMDHSRVPAKMVEMVGRAQSLEWIVTSNEVEALLLENNLIKQYRPQFNIRLRDDKSYPYIAITMEDEFPRVMFTRQPHRRSNLYFGPFASAARVRETLDVLRRIFPVRTCRGAKPGRRSGSPCLQFHIKRCPAPCVGNSEVTEYRSVVEQVVDLLSGRKTKVVAGLQKAMQEAAARQDFETAALYRDRLLALEHVLERQQIESTSLGSCDITGLAMDVQGANVQVFITRDGRLADRRSFSLVNVEGADEDEVFERFVGEYYGSALSVPTELIIPSSVGNGAALTAFLEGLRGTRVEVRQAERGDKRRLQELADRNAALALAHERAREDRSRERRYGALSRLEEVLRLSGPPLRIEGYDISNLGAENTVASMVVFEGGAAKKSDYRKFGISNSGQNDVAAMREVIIRRFTRSGGWEGEGRYDEGRYDPSFEAVPDLVLIDGGKGQLGAAIGALSEAGLDGAVAVVSLAKREEELFTPWASGPICLPPDDPGLLLLQRVRDEAHRFALGFHRAKRASQTTLSLLDQLPGVGEKRKKAIVQHFGSPERFLQASREELEAVPGLPGKVAREIHAHVHKTG
ncbi:MAG: excinuclease ABC subunit UvrC [Thermoleophilia bacterium]